MHLSPSETGGPAATFDQAVEASASGDHARAEALYGELARLSGGSYFRVRALEARRLRGAPDSDLIDLADIDVDLVIESLSLDHSVNLLARKMAVDGFDLNELPVELQDRREVLDGVGKFWETHGHLPPSVHLRTRAKRGQMVEDAGLVHDARPLELPVLPVLHSDAGLSEACGREHTMARLAGGWVELTDVHGASGSHSFIGEAAAYVDEYRAEFPPEADPRSDPVIFGVTNTDVLTLHTSTLKQRAILTGLEGFWLAGRFADEWGHWVTGHLARVQYLRHHPLWGKRPIYVSSGLPQAFLQFLDYLAPSIERIELDPGAIVHFDRVIAAPSRLFGPPNPRSALTGVPRHCFAEPEQLGNLCHELRGLASFSAEEWPRKALVSRNGYGRRRMENRTEFTSLLKGRGYEEVHFGRMSAPDQVGAWLRADTIVGETGSWMFMGGIAPDRQMTVVNSDWMDLWYADLGAINAIRDRPVGIVTGTQLDRDTVFTAEGAAHRRWTLGSAGLEALARAVEVAR